MNLCCERKIHLLTHCLHQPPGRLTSGPHIALVKRHISQTAEWSIFFSLCVSGGRGGPGHSATWTLTNTGSQVLPRPADSESPGVGSRVWVLLKALLPETSLGDAGLRIMPKWILHSKGFRRDLRLRGEPRPDWHEGGRAREVFLHLETCSPNNLRL